MGIVSYFASRYDRSRGAAYMFAAIILLGGLAGAVVVAAIGAVVGAVAGTGALLGAMWAGGVVAAATVGYSGFFIVPHIVKELCYRHELKNRYVSTVGPLPKGRRLDDMEMEREIICKKSDLKEAFRKKNQQDAVNPQNQPSPPAPN